LTYAGAFALTWFIGLRGLWLAVRIW